MEMEHRHGLTGSAGVEKSRRVHLSMLYRRPEVLDEGWVEAPGAEEMDRRLQETIDWWHYWSSRVKIQGPYAEQVERSALVLKGLCNAPTGAIAAAPTTSLPETLGGNRNWDYRFSWIRDSYFTVRSLGQLGYTKEADGFRRYIERTAAGSANELQIMFGLGGERRLLEFEIGELEGYKGSKPVRVGNAARRQVRLDVYGGVLDLSWRWHQWGHSPDDDYWDFLVHLVDAAANNWKNPDQDIWEIRGKGRHFVQSKVMCWVAMDRGMKMAEDVDREAPLERWKLTRDEMRSVIERQGYDTERGVFIQAFDHRVMDASLLLLPAVDFVAYEVERMIRTVDAVREELDEDGLLFRYLGGDDSMDGKEGAFVACAFWLAECLARQNRLEEAHNVFKRALATGNDLYLFSEEYDSGAKQMLGNFPQALTHLSLISAAVALREMTEGKQ